MKEWTLESTAPLEAPGSACGPTIHCVRLLGERTIRWRLAVNPSSLTADLVIRDFEHFKKEPVCQDHVVFRAELVPQ